MPIKFYQSASTYTLKPYLMLSTKIVQFHHLLRLYSTLYSINFSHPALGQHYYNLQQIN